jgi:hypothetical protein
MWDQFIQNKNLEAVLNDKGLAKIGDNLVNFCYSLAKSYVLGEATGEKVRDSVLARAIRATPVYTHMGRRTDAGRAADAYEALMAYLWLSGKLSIQSIVDSLVSTLHIDVHTSRKEEGNLAVVSFQLLLEQNVDLLP